MLLLDILGQRLPPTFGFRVKSDQSLLSAYRSLVLTKSM